MCFFQFLQGKIKKEDVDFHQCYGKAALQDLHERMKDKVYPPRFNVRIQAEDQNFFQHPRTVTVDLVCNTERIRKPMKIPGVGKCN